MISDLVEDLAGSEVVEEDVALVVEEARVWEEGTGLAGVEGMIDDCWIG